MVDKTNIKSSSYNFNDNNNINKKEFIDLDLVKGLIQISDLQLFQLYMKEVYKDLVDRAESSKKSGVSRVTFYEYIKLPVLLADKLFLAIDKDNDGYLGLKEFVEGLYNLYYGTFKQSAKVVFNMYDFDKDGIINKEDIKILFSYLPLKNEEKQMESLKEIDQILDEIKIDNNFSFNKFLDIVEKVKSDIYLQMLCYLIEHKPFALDNVEACKFLPKYQELQNSVNTGVGENNILASPEIKRKSTFIAENISLSSPSKSTIFKPVDNVLKMMEIEEFALETEENNDENNNDNNDVKVKLPIKNTNKLAIDKTINTNEINKEEMIRLPNQREYKDNNAYGTPTKFLKNSATVGEVEPFDLNKKSSFASSPFKSPSKKKSSIMSCKISENIVKKGGIIYKITENKNLKTYYLLLVNKDIYYYKSEKCKDLLGMHNLSGCYIMDVDEEKKKVDNKELYSFSVIFSNKIRSYYTHSREEAQDWVLSLKKATGYQSFTETYDMQSKTLGEGKFGLVKLGIHKKTGQKVAIKIIKKEAMTPKDQELVKSEIDIMKMCKHKNIVRLLDHFENNKYIFIVMEYLAGGTLANYLEHTPVDDLTEKDAGIITYQIAKALEYLHQFGIIHRDLKPENIMIKGKLPYDGLDALKIMDFGLSKVLGPNERVSDGYGTLTYVAPEVLTRKPYNKHVDVWSLGVIVFYTLSGNFPFDDPSNDEEVIAKKTVFSDLKFNHKSWPTRSSAVREFIVKCMTKDMEKRSKITELIEHKWFIECGILKKSSSNTDVNISPSKRAGSSFNPNKKGSINYNNAI